MLQLHSWKSVSKFFFLAQKANWLETWQQVSGPLVDQNYELKSFQLEIQNDRHGSHV